MELKKRIFKEYTRMVLQYCSIVQNLVNYHLVVSCLQMCHIGINVDYWCVIIIAVQIILLFAFSRTELLNDLYKL